jgi:hypothetical protein
VVACANPETLVAKIFKLKYFPENNFLHSSLGRRQSYARRSIWTAKNLLSEGMMWRVGDGNLTHILAGLLV